MTTTCAVTGHRPDSFAWNYYNKQDTRHIAYLNNIHDTLVDLTQKGYTNFIAGGALGVDMDFALAVLQLKHQYPHIQLELALPYPGWQMITNKEQQRNTQLLLQQADKVSNICEHYCQRCFFMRNQYMVDNAQLLLAYYNGMHKGGTYYTVQYATRKNIPIITYQL